MFFRTKLSREGRGSLFRKAVNKYRFQGAGVRSTKSHEGNTNPHKSGLVRAISWIVRHSDPDQIAANFRDRTLEGLVEANVQLRTLVVRVTTQPQQCCESIAGLLPLPLGEGSGVRV